MAVLTLVDSARKPPNTNLAHRASGTEGESAVRLLQEQGFIVKATANREASMLCPFHEGSGSVPRGKSPNFFVNLESGAYYCHSASCGERGNLQTLERFFGIGVDEEYVSAFRSREELLKEFERALVPALRKPFYEHGLKDETIERFRIGFEPEHTTETGTKIPDRYVIPYLDGRRPRFFRYYCPDQGQDDYDEKFKFTWEKGAEATLFNAQDAMGDPDGRVLMLEGELKPMLAVQLGYAAVGVPGAGQWKPDWQGLFTHARQIVVCFDNDNPDFHNYDKPEKGLSCRKCQIKGLDACVGHNPGQEAALVRVEQLGWRAKNVVLPLPGKRARKTDLNEFIVRDGHTAAEFGELVTGKKAAPYRVQSLAEIMLKPPEQAEFLVGHGILPKEGRLLIAGKPKVGKSIFLDNLILSLAAGIPFLGRFDIDHPTRVMLLDRELSRWGLFKRLQQLMADRPGYQAAVDNLLIDHDHLIRLEQPHAYDTIMKLVETNGIEVLCLDTAYKFFSSDVESSSTLMKGFDVLDRVIHETGVAIVMTHHMRKGQGSKGKDAPEHGDMDSVAGSFLWTGWPNATVLLNYLNRSIQDPFNAVCTFTAFRDDAAPDPLALYRSKDSISYSAVKEYTYEEMQEDQERTAVQSQKPSSEGVAEIMLEICPAVEDDILHVCAARFGVAINTVRPYYIDVMAAGAFERTGNRPPIVKFKIAEAEQTWEEEHGLAPHRMGPALAAGTSEIGDLFDAAALT